MAAQQGANPVSAMARVTMRRASSTQSTAALAPDVAMLHSKCGAKTAGYAVEAGHASAALL